MARLRAAIPRHTPLLTPEAGHRIATYGDGTTHLVRVLGVRRPIAVSGGRDERIAAIAKRQRGRVHRDQLLTVGVADRTIYRLLGGVKVHRTGTLNRIGPGRHRRAVAMVEGLRLTWPIPASETGGPSHPGWDRGIEVLGAP